VLVSLVPSFAEHTRPAAKPAGCKGALTNRQSPHLARGEASLAAGMAPAAAGHPAQWAGVHGSYSWLCRYPHNHDYDPFEIMESW